jgi:hypothetical protein
VVNTAILTRKGRSALDIPLDSSLIICTVAALRTLGLGHESLYETNTLIYKHFYWRNALDWA